MYFFGSHFTGFLVLLIFLIPQLIYSAINQDKFYKINYLLIFLIIFLMLANTINLNLFKKTNSFKEIEIDLIQMNFPVYNNNKTTNDDKYLNIINIIKKSDADLIILGENNYKRIKK